MGKKDKERERERVDRKKQTKKQQQIYDGDREGASARIYSFDSGEKKPSHMEVVWRPYGKDRRGTRARASRQKENRLKNRSRTRTETERAHLPSSFHLTAVQKTKNIF